MLEPWFEDAAGHMCRAIQERLDGYRLLEEDRCGTNALKRDVEIIATIGGGKWLRDFQKKSLHKHGQGLPKNVSVPQPCTYMQVKQHLGAMRFFGNGVELIEVIERPDVIQAKNTVGNPRV